MKYGSVCSGIEAATVAWHQLNWKPAFFSEIEKFPREVLAHHYPEVPLHGDFTTMQKENYEPIELLVGGTPCQSFSVAGLRAGLADPRGNLMLEFGALANRLQPRWLVWENVPGVLSSNGGRDFGSFLAMLAELGYGFSYRILDAQYFGVPQRRRRVFVIGHLGSWQRAAAVLFERDSLQGHPAPRRSERKTVAPTITRGFGDRGLDLDQIAGGDYKSPSDLISYALAGNTIGRKPNNGGNGTGWNEEVSYTLTKTDQHGITQGMSVRRLTPMECERLQGFPDNYTKISEKTSDGPRYKALGNSMAVPVMRWIGERINYVDKLAKNTMGFKA